MSDNEILNAVKTMLFGTTAGNFRDSLISLYINEVKDFMLNAGVSPNALKSEKSVGVIALGVNDLWNYQAGGVKWSEYFKQRLIQLAADPDQSYFDDKTLKTYLWYTKTTAPQTTNVLFDIPQYDPSSSDKIHVFVNGMLCVENVDYTQNDDEIIFSIPKVANTEIIVFVNKFVNSEN